jgi:putative ABC transport system ATP-binding protein
VQDVVLAMLAKEPAYGYELRSRMRGALGPLGEAMNAGQIYVTLARLAKAGLVTSQRAEGLPDRPDRRVYALTSAGQQRVAAWLAEVSWPKPDLSEFHLKLVAAAAARLADPVALVDAQRRELLRRLRETQRAALERSVDPVAGLLLEGVVLRLRADLEWLDACERMWTERDQTEQKGTDDRAERGPRGHARRYRMTGSALLRARGVTRWYGRGNALVRAVDEVDLEVPAGQTLAIMGPSGCGKSTLLHLLGGLQRPTGGEIWLAEHRIDGMSERGLARLRRHHIGFVFQSFHLMDELTAVENVELAALLSGQSPRRARQRAMTVLDRVGLADRAKHLPSALSGGQRQRVAIARALSNEPRVVLADEPTGNLDSAATLEVLRLFEELRLAGQTLVVVTHDARIAAVADRVISMRDGSFADDTRLAGTTTGTNVGTGTVYGGWR